MEIFCAKCGTKNNSKSRFCIKCGTKLDQSDANKKGINKSSSKKPFKKSYIVAIITAIVVISLIVWVLSIRTNNYAITSSTYYPIVHQTYTMNLFSQGQVFSLDPGHFEYSNFTIPSSAYNINITGSYTSQGDVEVAILTPAQFGAAIQNPSTMQSTSYYYGDTQGSTIYTSLPSGQYSLVFYDPGIVTQDTVTIVNPAVVKYTS